MWHSSSCCLSGEVSSRTSSPNLWDWAGTWRRPASGQVSAQANQERPGSQNISGVLGLQYIYMANTVSEMPGLNSSHLELTFVESSVAGAVPRWRPVDPIITHVPLFRESPLGDSCLVINIHNPLTHCATSHYVCKPRDVIMLMHAVTIVAA